MLSIRRAFTILEFIAVVVIISLLAVILFPVFSRKGPSPGSRERATCQSNLKQISLSLIQYVEDYNERFPPIIAKRGQGWVKITQPYWKNWQLFRCPSVESKQDETTDYFYNARLARFQMKNFENPSISVLLGDGTPDAPNSASLSALPKVWIDSSSSPIKRHLDGANYAFADGHVKWLKPEKITLDSPRKSSNSTFLPR